MKAMETLIEWSAPNGIRVRERYAPAIRTNEHWSHWNFDQWIDYGRFNDRVPKTPVNIQLNLAQLYLHIVLGYGIDPKLVAREFMKIDEFVEILGDMAKQGIAQ